MLIIILSLILPETDLIRLTSFTSLCSQNLSLIPPQAGLIRLAKFASLRSQILSLIPIHFIIGINSTNKFHFALLAKLESHPDTFHYRD